jgi:hypothetical protein
MRATNVGEDKDSLKRQRARVKRKTSSMRWAVMWSLR